MKLKKNLVEDFAIPGSAAMADLAMLLLVFFLVTTNIQQSSGLEVALPKSKVIEAVEKDFRITIDKQALVYLNEKPISSQTLPSRLIELGFKEQSRVSISADENLPYKVVDNVLKQLKKNDIVNVQFVSAAVEK